VLFPLLLSFPLLPRVLLVILAPAFFAPRLFARFIPFPFCGSLLLAFSVLPSLVSFRPPRARRRRLFLYSVPFSLCFCLFFRSSRSVPAFLFPCVGTYLLCASHSGLPPPCSWICNSLRGASPLRGSRVLFCVHVYVTLYALGFEPRSLVS